MAKDDEITPFSFKIFRLESAVRFAHFAIEEAYECRKKLFSRSPTKRKEGQDSAIKLLRTLRKQIMDYQNLRGSRSVRGLEKELINELRELSEEASLLLAEMKKQKKMGDWWNRKGVLRILRKIIGQEEAVSSIADRLKRKIPLRSDYFFAGIDGGATKTIAVVTDSNGNILGTETTGPFYPKMVGVIASFDSLITALKKATKKALKKAGLDEDLDFRTIKFKRICASLCGIGSRKHSRRTNELIKKYTKKFYPNIMEVIIVPDSLLAWYGGFGGKPGIVVIGGTGNVIYGRNGGKEAHSLIRWHVKNWSYLIRLEGRHISYHAALRIEKRLRNKSETKLVKLWRNAYKEGNIFRRQSSPFYSSLPFTKFIELFKKSLFRRSSPITDTEFSSMVKLVFAAAKEGDRDSIDIIQQAAETTCIGIEVVAKQIGLHNNNFKVAYVGSVIRNPFALMRLRHSLPLHEPYAKLVKPKFEPWIAAIEIAKRGIYFY